jgi:hypothetical protein
MVQKIVSRMLGTELIVWWAPRFRRALVAHNVSPSGLERRCSYPLLLQLASRFERELKMSRMFERL